MKLIAKDAAYTYTRTYECAAWYTNYTSTACEVEITDKPHPYDYGRKVYRATVPAVIVDDYFQSLFGGCAVGAAYDTKQNAGKPGEFTVAWSVQGLLLDENVILTDEEYDQVLEIAIKEATAHADYARKNLEKVINNPLIKDDKYRTADHDLRRTSDSFAKAMTTLSELTLTRTHREQRRDSRFTTGGLPRYKKY